RRTGLMEVSRSEVRAFFQSLLTGVRAPASPVVASLPPPTHAESAPNGREEAGDAVPLDVVAARADEYATNRQPRAVSFGDAPDVPIESWAGLAAAVVMWIGERRQLPN